MSSVVTGSERIPAAERREQILDAATRVFGELGYAGTTTDRVAREAGISQPYVVRMFGTKERLFIEVLERTCDRILAAFDAAVDADGDPRPLAARIGAAYVELVDTDRGILLSLMQGFILGHDPAIGPVARAGFMRLFERLREAGFGPDESTGFMARGMLINTLLASGLASSIGEDRCVSELFTSTFGDKIGIVAPSTQD